jgi:hypothetical protein
MYFTSALVAAVALALPALAVNPSMNVPACPKKGSVKGFGTVPSTDKTGFARTQVDLCYTATNLSITFTAYDETNFFTNKSLGTNGDIWAYEVMEAFIYHGTNDPATYLELEVSPANVTFQSFVYNPSKVRAPGTPFDHGFLDGPTDGIVSTTALNKRAKTWTSTLTVPLLLFNVDDGKASGTQWRMNFFRTITSSSTYPNQTLGAWSPPDTASFHVTPYFGYVNFV